MGKLLAIAKIFASCGAGDDFTRLSKDDGTEAVIGTRVSLV